MEEYDAPGLLVATTNIEDSLDSALFRRFDEVFLVPPPGDDEIENILKLMLSAVAVADNLEWQPIVQSLSGASAAMVVKAAQDAAKAAVLAGQKIVTASHLKAAIAELKRDDKPSRNG
jgi:SpoVK/Ycf46/Vps4 family AAA+-type ATPase